MTASISSLEITPCSTRYKASLSTANWILLATNPKTSFWTITGFLPIWILNSLIAYATVSKVLSPLIISISKIRWEGLNQCIPINLSGL